MENEYYSKTLQTPHTQNIHAQIQYAQKLWDVSTMMNNILKKKEDNMQKHEEERRERSFVESPNSRHGCLLDCICLLFIIMYFLCEELGLKY